MSMAITFVVSMMAILTVTFTLGQDMMQAFTDFSGTWIRQERRLEAQSDTRLSSPFGATVGESSTVRLILVNDGDEVLGSFQDWDLIIETLRPSTPGISYLTYTEDVVPGDN